MLILMVNKTMAKQKINHIKQRLNIDESHLIY
jgi:hypothetical protein